MAFAFLDYFLLSNLHNWHEKETLCLPVDDSISKAVGAEG